MTSLGTSLRRPNRFQVAVVLLVTLSGSFVTLHVGASLAVVAVVTALSFLVGVALTAYLTWISPDREEPERRW